MGGASLLASFVLYPQHFFFILQSSIVLNGLCWAIVALVLFTDARTNMACYPSNSESRVVG